MTTYWIGIDVGKRELVAALAGPDCDPRRWAQLPYRAFPQSEAGRRALLRWVQDQNVPRDQAQLVMEATGRLANRTLEAFQGRLDGAIVNPSRPREFARSMGIKGKCDRRDACALALYGRAFQPHPTRLLAGPHRELRELSRLQRALGKDRQRSHLRLEDGPQTPAVRRCLQGILRDFDRRLAQVEQAIQDRLESAPDLQEMIRRMATVAGIGESTARALVAELGDLSAWSRKELTGYVGLCPQPYESGTSVYHAPHLAKGGMSVLRGKLYWCALAAIRYNPPLQRFYQGLLARGKQKRVAVGAVMHKLLLIARAVVKSETDWTPDYPG